jgi:hypothetical protein
VIDDLLKPASSSEAVANDVEDDGPPRLTYAELVNLIQTGAPIPGIKDVPDTVLTGQASSSAATKRRKPWEQEDGVGDSTDKNPRPHEQTV